MDEEKKEDKIDFIESMKILKCEPGDIIILKVDQIIDGEIRDMITRNVRNVENIVKNKVLILDKRIDLGVLRNAEDT